MRVFQILVCLLACVFGSAWVVAQERIQLEGDSVIGNQESPKALFIVPWRSLTATGVVGLELESLLDEELKAIDRDVFKRKVELYNVANDVNVID